MSKSLSFADIDEEVSHVALDSKHASNISSDPFLTLKEKTEGSKAELVCVAVRMTRAERRQLRAMAGQLEMPMQDIVRKGIALFRAEQGLR